jgi:hypothetical protein
MARRVEFGVMVDRWVRLRQSDEAADPPFVLDEHGFLASRADLISASWFGPGSAL